MELFSIKIRRTFQLVSTFFIHDRNHNRNAYAGLAKSAMRFAALRTECRVQDWSRGYHPCHISLLFAFLFAFLDRARSAETSVSVSIRMESRGFCVHYQGCVFFITFINKFLGVRKIHTGEIGGKICFPGTDFARFNGK